MSSRIQQCFTISMVTRSYYGVLVIGIDWTLVYLEMLNSKIVYYRLAPMAKIIAIFLVAYLVRSILSQSPSWLINLDCYTWSPPNFLFSNMSFNVFLPSSYCYYLCIINMSFSFLIYI